MKANEYINKYGVDAVRSYLAAYEDALTDDLKRLVESHDLVALFDDIDCAKAWVSDLDSDWPYQVKGADTKFFKWQLEQAILDVESCQ